MNRVSYVRAVMIGSLAVAMIGVMFSVDVLARGSWQGGIRFGPGWGPGRALHPGLETGNVVYTVCKFFDPERNCNKCSDYFTVRSEDEAQDKCSRGGYEDAYYFPSVSRVYSWMGGHCTCGNDEGP